MNKPGMAVQSICVGGAYAILYYALKDTPSHFNVSAGLRLAALMLLPYRLWPALLIGDMWANAVYASPRFGIEPYTAWSAVIAIALHPLSSLPAACLAKRMKVDLITPAPRDIWSMMAVIFAAALVNSLSGIVYNLSIAVPSASRVVSLRGTFELYFLGVTLGALTVVPALTWAAHEAKHARLDPRRLGGDGYGSMAVLIGICAAGLGAAIWLADATGEGHLLMPLRLAMFLPVVICTLKHGPRGAALSILLANAAIDLTPFVARDPELIKVQEISVLVCFTAMLFGAHGSRQRDSMRQSEAREERAIAYARQVESMPNRIREYQASMLDDLYERLAESEVALRDPQVDRQQAQQLWWRIISRTRSELRTRREALRPALLESHGLKAAILDCPILAALHEAGVSVHPHLMDDVSILAAPTQYAAYQLIHEALDEALQRSATQCVLIRVRTGIHGARRWVAIRMVISIAIGSDETASTSANDETSHLDELARAYGGVMRRGMRDGRRVVAAILYDQSIEQLVSEASRRHAARA